MIKLFNVVVVLVFLMQLRPVLNIKYSPFQPAMFCPHPNSSQRATLKWSELLLVRVHFFLTVYV